MINELKLKLEDAQTSAHEALGAIKSAEELLTLYGDSNAEYFMQGALFLLEAARKKLEEVEGDE